MKSWTPEALPDRWLAAEREFRAWGHDFNARGILENNQGCADYIRQCPQSVSGCCGNFGPRQAYPHFVGPSRRSYRLKPESLKRKASL
jgi:hypothetical protein